MTPQIAGTGVTEPATKRLAAGIQHAVSALRGNAKMSVSTRTSIVDASGRTQSARGREIPERCSHCFPVGVLLQVNFLLSVLSSFDLSGNSGRYFWEERVVKNE